MTPQVWLHRHDEATMRTVQRPTDDGFEVLLVGSTGERAHHRFATNGEALAFREALHTRIEAHGFTLAWTSAAGD